MMMAFLLGAAAACAFLIGLAIAMTIWTVPRPENFGFFGDKIDE